MRRSSRGLLHSNVVSGHRISIPLLCEGNLSASTRFFFIGPQTTCAIVRAMWQQNYTPIANSLALSALVAAVPIFVLLYLIGIRRKPAWIASLSGLGATVMLAAVVYVMPAVMVCSSVFVGAGLCRVPIGF